MFEFIRNLKRKLEQDEKEIAVKAVLEGSKVLQSPKYNFTLERATRWLNETLDNYDALQQK